MTKDERRPWLVLASLFVTLFFVFPTGNGFGVFLPYLVKQFNCSRAQGASLFSLWTITMGLSAPLVGRMLDRFQARYIMAAGVIICAAAVLWASRVETFTGMTGAYLLMGVGVGLSCIVPCSVVTARWFGANRGLAMGLMFAGTSSGASVITLVTAYVAADAGWRAAYFLMAVPMLAIAVPLQFLMAKISPPAQNREHAPESRGTGLTVTAAIRTRSFWLIALAHFCFTFVVTAMVAHLFSYLLECGYRHQSAALAVSLTLVGATFGKPLTGWFADHVSARRALVACFFGEALSLLIVLKGRHLGALAMFVPLFGLTFSSPLALISLLIAESLGLEFYGSLSGVINSLTPVGSLLGPVLMGRIFDATKSYVPALELCAALAVLGALAVSACLPLHTLEAKLRSAEMAIATEI